MDETLPPKKENRDIDNIYLELERLNIPATDISAVMLEPDHGSLIPLKGGGYFPYGSPLIGFNCETTKEQGLTYLEKYSGKFKFLQVMLIDDNKLFFDKNGFHTSMENLGF